MCRELGLCGRPRGGGEGGHPVSRMGVVAGMWVRGPLGRQDGDAWGEPLPQAGEEVGALVEPRCTPENK